MKRFESKYSSCMTPCGLKLHDMTLSNRKLNDLKLYDLISRYESVRYGTLWFDSTLDLWYKKLFAVELMM